jgi:SAM-dependent methyltransferase
LLLPLILLLIVLPFGIAGLIGAPYVPVLRKDSRRLLEQTGLKPGQTLVDLGSGDGRLLRAAAAQGIRCIGYEINPYLVLISRIVCFRYRKLVTIHTADIWHTKLPEADVIYIFLLERFMVRLDQKFTSEITKPTKVISYVFKLPREPISKTNNTQVYLYGTPSSPA